MLFSVIYEADTCKGERVSRYAPPRSRAWQLTEQGRTEYSYLEGAWEKGQHRKWCGLLTRKQFEAFVASVRLEAEDCETMGSMGAPGVEPFYALSPAISMRGDEYGAILSAYVTPLPARKVGRHYEPIRKEGATDRDWARVRRAFLNTY